MKITKQERKSIIKRLNIVFTILTGLIYLSACSAPNAANRVYTSPGPLTDHVTIKEDEVIAWEYEEFDDALQIGSLKLTAHDGEHAGYRGVLTVSDKLVNDYNLTAGDEEELFLTFDEIDISKYGSHWYYCENLYYVFGSDFSIEELYFDGNNKILFCISEKDND